MQPRLQKLHECFTQTHQSEYSKDMEYSPADLEAKWQAYWQTHKKYEVRELEESSTKPKYYALDMFPYPSGAGLHVGHPLGYIASDVVARYKRHSGYNVLHPMGFDAFGLPAEQYAIDTGQHPAITTAQNIETYKKQLKKIGFSYDWAREVITAEPSYYKWTQWIFMQLFQAWYNQDAQKAEPIASLIAIFEQEGNKNVRAAHNEQTPVFSAQDWASFDEAQKAMLLLNYRLTYLAEAVVNWCPALGSVLANDEVKDGFSERGGHPVERKKMKQWMMRLTAYAERLLEGLNHIDWSDALKDIQRNWIGKSLGAELAFKVEHNNLELTVFTTRIDTIFGVTFISVAPESELISQLTAPAQAQQVADYVQKAKNRSERERQADVKTVSGAFLGTYAINPFTGEQVPIWVADYVLSGYGTGVVMGVPAADERDHRFAKHFGLPIRCIIEGTEDLANPTEKKTGCLINSGFLNGLHQTEAIQKAVDFIQKKGLGQGKINYKLRDAVFGRQRYWGEPIPVYYKNGAPFLLDEASLPLVLPEIDQFKPTESGEPPLARAKSWEHQGQYAYEHTTMPGWAGSSWYFLRYMDAHNQNTFVSKKKADYWGQVDLYMGGAEHATGHLLYSRFWNLVLFDLGYLSHAEPFKKLINQGMIQGRSSLVYKRRDADIFVSYKLRQADTANDYQELHVDVSLVSNDLLNVEAFKKWRPEYESAEFVLDNGKFECNWQVEKMSKRWYNVVNPDDVIARYGADALRLYEMFLGPLEYSKPWDTSGIDGVSRFLRKLWRSCIGREGECLVAEAEATEKENKILHTLIKRVREDLDRFSFNTVVSSYMIALNELNALECKNKMVFEQFLILLSPFAPHIAEELWQRLGHSESILDEPFPIFEAKYLAESGFEYPVSINGKMRASIWLANGVSAEEAQIKTLALEKVQAWLDGKALKKCIFVPNKIINLVI